MELKGVSDLVPWRGAWASAGREFKHQSVRNPIPPGRGFSSRSPSESDPLLVAVVAAAAAAAAAAVLVAPAVAALPVVHQGVPGVCLHCRTCLVFSSPEAEFLPSKPSLS